MKAKSFQPVLPTFWWLQRGNYRRYMLRELSSLPIALYAVWLILALLRLGQGAEAWAAFRASLASPLAIALQGIVLVFALIHSLSWFALAPRTLPLYIGTRRVADGWIAAAHYLAWAVLSVLIFLAIGV
ncbi:MAG: hypothetical protein AB7V26_05980 [Lysobacterales bacterium]